MSRAREVRESTKLMRETWPYYKNYFKDYKDDYTIFSSILESALIKSNYVKYIKDKEGKVQAFMYANIKTKKQKPKIYKLFYLIKYITLMLLGFMGNRKQVLQSSKKFDELMIGIEKKNPGYDAELKLFIISKSLRGQGYGKKMINDLFDEIKRSGGASIYLLTDKGCNYKFYDALGFDLKYTFHSPLLDKSEEESNGFIYTKVLK